MPRIRNPRTKEDYVQQKYIFDRAGLAALTADLLILRQKSVDGFHPTDIIRATRRLLGNIVSCDIYCFKGWIVQIKKPDEHPDNDKVDAINAYLYKHRSLYAYRELIKSISERVTEFKDMTLNQKFDMMGDLIDDLLVLNTKLELVFLSMEVRK